MCTVVCGTCGAQFCLEFPWIKFWIPYPLTPVMCYNRVRTYIICFKAVSLYALSYLQGLPTTYVISFLWLTLKLKVWEETTLCSSSCDSLGGGVVDLKSEKWLTRKKANQALNTKQVSCSFTPAVLQQILCTRGSLAQGYLFPSLLQVLLLA